MEGSRRAQAAIEYLTTYSWAILIIAVGLAALVLLNVFNPYLFVASKCAPPADFVCTNASLSTSGNFVFTLGQATTSPIYVTALGCNSNNTVANVKTFNAPGVFLPIGGNFTTSVQCYAGASRYSSKLGGYFTGYLFINYTNINTGLGLTSAGSLAEKVTTK